MTERALPTPADELLRPTRGDYELEERTSLRRVAGLSTELEDVTEVEYRQLRLERVVLVGVWTEGTAADAELSLRELAALAETAGSEVLDGVIQRPDRPDPATYIGSGKAPRGEGRHEQARAHQARRRASRLRPIGSAAGLHQRG